MLTKIIDVTKNRYNVHAELHGRLVCRPRVDHISPWSLDIFCGRLVNLGRALVEVKPGPSGRVTDPLSRPRLPVAARVPARAQLPPCAASSFGLVDRRGHGHAHAHPGRLRFGPAGLECRLSSAGPQ